MIHIKMFGVLSITLLAMAVPHCNDNDEEIIIPYGIYTSTNGNARLNFRDESHLTMEFPNVVMEARYQLVQKEYSPMIKIVFESGLDTMIAEYLIEEDYSIYLMYFKTKENIAHHIDEIGRFYSSGYSRMEPVNCSTIILDSIQTGEYFVHFENTLSLYNNNCDTIFIAQPGLSRVVGNIDLRNLDQIQILSASGQIIDSVPLTSENAYYDVDILGFNQVARTLVENELNERMQGNILMFSIKKKTHSPHKSDIGK